MADLYSLFKQNVPQVGGGGNLDNKIILFSKDDVLKPFPKRDKNNMGVINENIRFKTGKKMHLLYTTKQTLEPSCNRIAGSNADCYGYEVGLSGFHPGLSEAVLDYVTRNGDFEGFVILQSYDADENQVNYLLGEYASPVGISTEMKWGKIQTEDKGVTFSFKSTQSKPLAIYKGVLTLENDVEIAPDTEVIENVQGQKLKLLGSDTEAVTIQNITDVQDGDLIYIVGGPGKYPSKIQANEAFILKGSEDFIAKEGSEITLKAFDNGGGTFVFIEQSRI